MKKERFTILLCGARTMMEKVRKLIPPAPEVHLKFASSPGFLAGRSLFNTPKLVLIDVNNEPPFLRSSLSEFTEKFPAVPILALSRVAEHLSAVDLGKAGVSSFFEFPGEDKKISSKIVSSYKEWSLKRKKDEFVEIQQETYDFRHIIGNSDALNSTIERARKIIKNDTKMVLITGETGTGKELFARAIHYNARDKSSPFVDIGCSALPETLLESELFGYERGAFTDAKDRKTGLFEIAGEGTIFLDEIGDISLSTQSKLLKVIEDRTMRRLGGVQDIPVRARIIAATSADLESKMKSGEFRKDLYHRLKILPLELPPLRDRVDDIPLLVDEFLKTYNETYGKYIRGVTHHAIQLLMDHDWEGNVRELRHTIERAVLLEEGDQISEKDLELLSRKPGRKSVLANPDTDSVSRGEDSLVIMLPFRDASVNEVQQLLVRKVLEHVGGNKLKASRILKISRPRLDRILKAANEAD